MCLHWCDHPCWVNWYTVPRMLSLCIVSLSYSISWSCKSYVVYLYIQVDLWGSSCWVVAQSIGQLHLMCLVRFWWSRQISVTLGAFSADEEGHWPSSSWQSSLMVCDHSLLWNSFPVDMWWGTVGIPSLYIYEALAGKGNELVFSIMLLYLTHSKAS